jgi:hypothetical protein
VGGFCGNREWGPAPASCTARLGEGVGWKLTAASGWKRVLPKVRFLVVYCHAIQLPFMTFGIVPKAEYDNAKRDARKLTFRVLKVGMKASLGPDLLLWLAVTERPGALRRLFDFDSVELDQVLED